MNKDTRNKLDQLFTELLVQGHFLFGYALAMANEEDVEILKQSFKILVDNANEIDFELELHGDIDWKDAQIKDGIESDM